MKYLIPISIYCLFLIAPLSHAEREAHGGDSYSLNFMGIAEISINYLAKKYAPTLKTYNLDTKLPEKLKDAFEQTNVNSWYRICLIEKEKRAFEIFKSEDCINAGGVEKEAVNIHNDKNFDIFVSRQSWNKLESYIFKKINLIIHEYLTIAGYNDTKGSLSNKITELFKNEESEFLYWFGKKFKYFSDCKYVCIVDGIINDIPQILSFEWEGEKTLKWFKDNRAIAFKTDDDFTVRNRGKTHPALYYAVLEASDRTVMTQTWLTDWIEINFADKNRIFKYIPLIDSQLRCYRVIDKEFIKKEAWE